MHTSAGSEYYGGFLSLDDTSQFGLKFIQSQTPITMYYYTLHANVHEVIPSLVGSTGLSSLLAGDVSPPKNDARGLFKSYRERSTSAHEDAGLRATKTQETQADPISAGRFSRPQASIETTQSYRHSMSSFPSATAGVKMR